MEAKAQPVCVLTTENLFNDKLLKQVKMKENHV